MILVDTSIWIDHFAKADPVLALLISDNKIVQHPYVSGEILVGNPHRRDALSLFLRMMPRIEPVTEEEFHSFLDESELFGSGLGFVDIHLIAAATAIPDTVIWTRDRRMLEQIQRFNMSYQP